MQVAFYKSRKRLFNRLVSWWLVGPYSHCELILHADANGYSTCASASYMDGGVRVKTMRLDPEHWDIVDVPDSYLSAKQWLYRHEDDRYDILGLLGFVWRRQSGEQDKWFCSEAVAAMLGYSEPWRYDPMTFYSAVTRPEIKQ